MRDFKVAIVVSNKAASVASNLHVVSHAHQAECPATGVVNWPSLRTFGRQYLKSDNYVNLTRGYTEVTHEKLVKGYLGIISSKLDWVSTCNRSSQLREQIIFGSLGPFGQVTACGFPILTME